jgi:hypothetical protein
MLAETCFERMLWPSMSGQILAIPLPWPLSPSFVPAGTGEVLATMDADLAQFMLDLTPEQLNRTAIVFIADHGLTMGLNYMYTQDGRVSRCAVVQMQMSGGVGP